MSRVSCLLRFSGSQYWGVLKLEVNMNFGKKQNQFKTLQVIYQSLCLAGGIAMLGSLLFQDIFATIPGLFRGPSSSEEHLNLIWLTNSELTGYSQIHWGFYSYSWIIFQILNTYVVIKKHWYIFLLTFTKKLTKCRYLTPCCDLEAWPCFGGFFSPKNKRHLQVPGKKKAVSRMDGIWPKHKYFTNPDLGIFLPQPPFGGPKLLWGRRGRGDRHMT